MVTANARASHSTRPPARTITNTVPAAVVSMRRTGVPNRRCSSTSPPGSAPSIESRWSSASASPIDRKMPGTSSSTAAAASAIAKAVWTQDGAARW